MCRLGIDRAITDLLISLLGVKSFTVNLDTEQVIVETILSTGQVQDLIENSGRMAILRGLGAPGKTGLVCKLPYCESFMLGL